MTFLKRLLFLEKFEIFLQKIENKTIKFLTENLFITEI